jgi:hypothetical protein
VFASVELPNVQIEMTDDKNKNKPTFITRLKTGKFGGRGRGRDCL